ncbi:MAG TPA: hypothetical protein VH257_21105 [Chloroflexota bacterium]|nr:hypothetical protein [Chloroflexota bacterium]
MEDAPRRDATRTRFDARGGCPACGAPLSRVRVLETRRRVDGSLRRRRHCLACAHRWTTAEEAATSLLGGHLPVRRVVREVPVPVPVPLPLPHSGRAGYEVSPWGVVESAAHAGAPVFVEYDPQRRVWLCALTDELNPAEGETAGMAIRRAEAGLRRLLGLAG